VPKEEKMRRAPTINDARVVDVNVEPSMPVILIRVDNAVESMAYE